MQSMTCNVKYEANDNKNYTTNNMKQQQKKKNDALRM